LGGNYHGAALARRLVGCLLSVVRQPQGGHRPQLLSAYDAGFVIQSRRRTAKDLVLDAFAI
jgi:hypothetical protein